ncbi:MAG: AEC family transporter [Candidatus Borkfalkiaceae bacterium]|nr:AEC family transporter [Christensenellaceae bacterium]
MFGITIKQVALLLFYILIGYVLTRKKIIGDGASKIISKLLVWVFTPFYTVVNLSRNVSVEKIRLYLSLFLAGTVYAVLAVAAACLIAKFLCKKSYVRNIYTYLLAFSNSGYFGYPLVEAVFGGETLAHFMIFCIATSVAINTFGYYILTNVVSEESENAGQSSGVKKNRFAFLYSPPMLGTYAGLLLGLLPIQVPQLVYDFLSPAANCMSPSAMILVGCVLAGVSVKRLFTSYKSYILGVIRLIILPALFGATVYLIYKAFNAPADIFVFFTLLSGLPAGMNAVVFPESVGQDGSEGAIACFISYVMCLITVPTMISAVSALL